MEKILKINYATGTLVCVDSFRAEMKGVHAVLGGGSIVFLLGSIVV